MDNELAHWSKGSTTALAHLGSRPRWLSRMELALS